MKFKQKTKSLISMRFNERLWSYFTLFLATISLIMFMSTIILSYKLFDLNSNCHNEQPPNIHTLNSINQSKRNSDNFHRLAILVPFRDRFEELLEFVPYINSFLIKQNINHDIFILNQVDSYRFNRASLINVGYLDVKSSYDYIAMHDVDLLPLNQNLSYAYPKLPYHVAAPDLHPKYHYSKFIGGILLINREQFEHVDGLSNNYWGWGLEDDEFYVRLKEAQLNITRPANITTGIRNTFKHIHGKDRKRDTIRCYNQREVTRKRDRKTGLHNVKYEITSRKIMSIDNVYFTLINIKLHCDFQLTPWCNCTYSNENKKL